MRSIQDELRSLPLFSQVSRSEMATISRLVTRLNLSAGKTLVNEGAYGNEFMIILEGEADVRQGGRLIATIGPGELVGEMALLDTDGRGRRNATVTALTDLVIYVGTPQEFRWMMHVAPSVGEKVHQTAATRALRVA